MSHKTSIAVPDLLWEEVQRYAEEHDLKVSAIFRLGFRNLKGGQNEKRKTRAKATA